MARTADFALRYFPHYIDQGKKMEHLKAAFGGTGKHLYFELLEMTYGNKGYYLQWDEGDIELVADRLRWDRQTCRAALAMSLDKGLFHRGLFDKHSILTSASIQKQFLDCKDRRAILRIIRAYWLIDQTETLLERRVEWIVSVPYSGHYAREPAISPGEMPDNAANSDKEKESKVNDYRERIARAKTNDFVATDYQRVVIPFWKEISPNGGYQPWHENHFWETFKKYGAGLLMENMYEFRVGQHRDLKLIDRALEGKFDWNYKQNFVKSGDILSANRKSNNQSRAEFKQELSDYAEIYAIHAPGEHPRDGPDG